MNPDWKKRALFVVTVCVAYALFGWGFASQSEGLITPEMSVSPWPLALGIGTILFRLVGLFWLLPQCAYWFVRGVAARIMKGDG